MAPSAILDFEIRFSDAALLLGMCRGLNLWSLTVLRSAVEKLLRFLFSIGNALEVPKIGVLGDFMGHNWHMYLREPQKAPQSVKTRVLTDRAPKSVHNCDLWSVSVNTTGNSSWTKFKITVGVHPCVFKWQIFNTEPYRPFVSDQKLLIPVPAGWTV